MSPSHHDDVELFHTLKPLWQFLEYFKPIDSGRQASDRRGAKVAIKQEFSL
jgi:hypothetical protein